MTRLHSLYIRFLAALLARSDQGRLFAWAPDPLRTSLERRFARVYLRHRDEVLDAFARRSGGEGRAEGHASPFELRIERSPEAASRRAA